MSSSDPWSLPARTESIEDSEVNFAFSYDHNNLDLHHQFMEKIFGGQNPTDSCFEDDFEVALRSEALRSSGNNRRLASQKFSDYIIAECKSPAQSNAIKMILNVLENYCFYPSRSDSGHNNNLIVEPPIISMVGVPGARKSWVVSQIRKRCSIRMHNNTHPCDSAGSRTVTESRLGDELSSQVASIIQGTTEGNFGNTAAIAYSGATAGLIKRRNRTQCSEDTN